VGLAADGNRDSAVNHTDFNIWRANFGAVAGNPVGPGAFVPEPSTALLTTLATSGVWIAAHAARARIVLSAIRQAMRRNLDTLCAKRLLLLRQREA
jgi:hypothetical protein